MSAQEVIHMICDGREFYRRRCKVQKVMIVGTIYEARAILKQQGWTHRQIVGGRIDLCPRCSPAYVKPVGMKTSPGRPKVSR